METLKERSGLSVFLLSGSKQQKSWIYILYVSDCFVFMYDCVCITVSGLQAIKVQVSLKPNTSPLSVCKWEDVFERVFDEGSLWEMSIVSSGEGWMPRKVWWWMTDRKRGDFEIYSGREGKAKERRKLESRERDSAMKNREGLLSQYPASAVDKVLL